MPYTYDRRNASSTVDVGLTWQSPNGPRKVERIQQEPRLGNRLMAYVSTAGGHQYEIIPVEDIPSTIRIDESRAASRLKQQQQAQQEATEKARRDSWNGFTDRMSPTMKARTISTLEKQYHHKGSFQPLGELIEKLVKDGFDVVPDPKYKRRLEHPNGVFFYEKDLTKIGLDYAAYLISRHF